VEDTDTPADPEAPADGDATNTVEGGAGGGKTSSCSTGLAASFWLGLTGLMGAAGRRRAHSI
jgi:hypothetical protein